MSQRTVNSTGNKGRFLIIDADGNNWTDRAYNSPGIALSVILPNGTEAAITLASAGDLLNRGKGVYEVAVPDSAYTSLGDLTLCGVITDGFVIGFGQQVIAGEPVALENDVVIVRSVDDESPITFAWPNSTDTVTGRVSINGGAWQNVVGSPIEYLRTDGVIDLYTLPHAAPDRPSAEGTARYEFSAGGVVIFYTLRVEPAGGGTAQSGDWAITRTFQVSGGAKVPGVRMSLVGVAGKTDTTGTDGIATIMADDDTFTLRVVVPAGYEDVADTSVTIDGDDDTSTVTLVATTIPEPPDADACTLSIYVRNQAKAAFPGVTVSARFPRGFAVADGTMNLNEVVTDVTDANGLAQLILFRGQDYDLSFSRENGTIAKIRITTPDAGTSTLTQSYQG